MLTLRHITSSSNDRKCVLEGFIDSGVNFFDGASRDVGLNSQSTNGQYVECPLGGYEVGGEAPRQVLPEQSQ